MFTYDKFINEKLELVNWDLYSKLVTEAYLKANIFDESAVKHWEALNESNKKLYKRLLSKVKVETVTGQPYETQKEMKDDVLKTNVIKISSDHSEHPVFTVEENVIFRAVHDYIIHILNDTPFGLKGELKSANFHMKLLPELAKPALFTEVVGQVCTTIVTGDFPEQKVAVLNGFDYNNIGRVEGYKIINKKLYKDE